MNVFSFILDLAPPGSEFELSMTSVIGDKKNNSVNVDVLKNLAKVYDIQTAVPSSRKGTMSMTSEFSKSVPYFSQRPVERDSINPEVNRTYLLQWPDGNSSIQPDPKDPVGRLSIKECLLADKERVKKMKEQSGEQPKKKFMDNNPDVSAYCI